MKIEVGNEEIVFIAETSDERIKLSKWERRLNKDGCSNIKWGTSGSILFVDFEGIKSQYEDRITELEDELDSVRAEVDELENTIYNLDDEIYDLKGEIDDKDKEIQLLKKSNL